MPEQYRVSPPQRLHRLIVMVAIASVVVVVLAACGSSSKSTPSSSTSSADTTQNASRAHRFASVRACLRKEGINLPSAPSGGRPGSGGPPGAARGRFKLPAGVSQSRFREALKKCGGGFPGRARGGFNSAGARAALTTFAACMRENGVKLPTANTSGTGPIFNTKGIDTSSATFRKAQQKCQSKLRGAFAGARPPGGGAGGPPSSAESGPPPGVPGGEGPPAG